MRKSDFGLEIIREAGDRYIPQKGEQVVRKHYSQVAAKEIHQPRFVSASGGQK